ncbi:hypothetical protein AVEN_232402-1 [Araneus ventricosus]|uniref:Uncharacterized protein n=1 Tax=Araneus ventricosus TaxID=182803 RepID=A0A4Y2CV42_ARAVE|nr:hypothetical protein AVEN_232402-1 [Araneus ventricosus]
MTPELATPSPTTPAGGRLIHTKTNWLQAHKHGGSSEAQNLPPGFLAQRTIGRKLPTDKYHPKLESNLQLRHKDHTTNLILLVCCASEARIG